MPQGLDFIGNFMRQLQSPLVAIYEMKNELDFSIL